MDEEKGIVSYYFSKYGGGKWVRSALNLSVPGHRLVNFVENMAGNIALGFQSFGGVSISGTFFGSSLVQGITTVKRNPLSGSLYLVAAGLHGGACACYAISSCKGQIVSPSVLVTSGLGVTLDNFAHKVDTVALVAKGIPKF